MATEETLVQHCYATLIRGLTWDFVVGRDGIEPPTLRFSAARSTN